MSGLRETLLKDSDSSSDNEGPHRMVLESKVIDSADHLLRGSRKRKEFILGDLQMLETINHESEQKVLSQLEGLARDTQSYEEKLRVLREQLSLKESQNKEIYKKRIQQMYDQFERLKELFDLFKLGIYLAKKDFLRKAKAEIALKGNSFDKAKRALKEKHLRGKLIRGTLEEMLVGESDGRQTDFAYKVYLSKLKGDAYLALKANAYMNILQRVNSQIQTTHPRYVEISDERVLTAQYQYENTVKPIMVQKVKRVQKKEKIKIVKRPRVRPPKINKKRQQIILKAPPPVQSQTQAVTVHLKVEPTTKQEPSHSHHKCHKAACQTHYPGRNGTPTSRRNPVSPGAQSFGYRQQERTPTKYSNNARQIYGPYHRDNSRQTSYNPNNYGLEEFPAPSYPGRGPPQQARGSPRPGQDYSQAERRGRY